MHICLSNARHTTTLSQDRSCGQRTQDAQDVFCSTKPSWQGDRCAPPLHPPGRGSVRALNPCLSQQTVSPVNHSRETSLSLHPSIPSGRSGAIAPREPARTVWPMHRQSGERSCSPDTPMTTSWRPTLRGLDAATSWRRFHRDQGGEPSRCPSLEPPHRPRGASHPLEPRPTLRGLDARLLEQVPVTSLFRRKSAFNIPPRCG